MENQQEPSDTNGTQRKRIKLSTIGYIIFGCVFIGGGPAIILFGKELIAPIIALGLIAALGCVIVGLIKEGEKGLLIKVILMAVTFALVRVFYH